LYALGTAPAVGRPCRRHVFTPIDSIFTGLLVPESQLVQAKRGNAIFLAINSNTPERPKMAPNFVISRILTNLVQVN
jgi:hypothetical protein